MDIKAVTFETTALERNTLLSKLIEGHHKRDPQLEQKIRSTIEASNTEEKVPELALKAYCFLGDIEKVKELILKVPKINGKNIKCYISPALESGNTEVLNLILKGVKADDIPKHTLRSAVSQACTLGYKNPLEILFRKAKLNELDELNLKIVGVGSLLDENLHIFTIICKHAKSQWFGNWITHLSDKIKDTKFASPHTISLFSKGIAIIESEMKKRRLLTKIREAKNYQIEI